MGNGLVPVGKLPFRRQAPSSLLTMLKPTGCAAMGEYVWLAMTAVCKTVTLETPQVRLLLLPPVFKNNCKCSDGGIYGYFRQFYMQDTRF